MTVDDVMADYSTATTYRVTTDRYWYLDAYPQSPVVETTTTEFIEPHDGGEVIEQVATICNSMPSAGATAITEQEYVDILASRETADPVQQMQDNHRAACEQRAAGCATAYDDLIAAGVPAATATFLTGHTP